MNQKQKKTRSPNFLSQEELAELCILVAGNMRELLDHFELEYEDLGDLIRMVCPIHEGADNPHGCTIRLNPEQEFYGCWKCWTNQCEKEFFTTPIGFIRALLSRDREENATFKEAVTFALKFTNPKSLDNDFDFVERNFQRIINAVNSKPEKKTSGISRQDVRKALVMPPQYYIKRGYSKEVLDKFDIGLSIKEGSPMKNRVVVPVYDDDHEFVVAHLGRQTTEQDNGYKWINSKNFKKSNYLYGYWFAKDKIRELRSVILVEGQGDVWRLHESGIENVVGMFGASLSDAQSRIIETSGAFNVIILTDNDNAGEKAKQTIRERLGRICKIIEPQIPAKDVGEMTVEEIRQMIVPQIQKWI